MNYYTNLIFGNGRQYQVVYQFDNDHAAIEWAENNNNGSGEITFFVDSIQSPAGQWIYS